jgi:hypothetical protein
MPLTTMLVDVLTRVTELVRIDEKASGISNFEGLIFDLRAMPMTTGTKKAVAAVLLMKALRPAAESASCEVNHAGTLQRRGHDQQTENHDYRIAAEACEGFLRRDQVCKNQREQNSECDNVRRNLLAPEQDSCDQDDSQQQSDLDGHFTNPSGCGLFGWS